jgi:hypothetical protein
MLVRVVEELLGDEVLASDGRLGTLEDVYFDPRCWQVRYLLVGAGARRALVSAACVACAAPARQRVTLSMSRAQLDAGAGAWPMDSAVQWLGDMRACSARGALGWRILAADGSAAGGVADLLVDPASWAIDYLVAATLDAFGPRQLLLPLDWVDAREPFDGALRMRRTRAQLSSAPEMASLLPAKARG